MISYLLRIAVGVALWICVVMMVVGVDPALVEDILFAGSYSPLIIVLGVASWYTATGLLGSAWRGLLATCWVLLNIILMILAVWTWLILASSLAVLLFGVWLSYQSHDKVVDDNTSTTRSGGSI